MDALATAWDACGGPLGLLLVPVFVGSIYSLLTVGTTALFVRRKPPATSDAGRSWPGATRDAECSWPPVTLLKPLHGLDKDLERNLQSACTLDYPEYQVVLSVQRGDDPALPLMRKLQEQFGPERVSVVVGDDGDPLPNGKIDNLVGGMREARHDLLVISDSDVSLRPDYLKTMIAPLEDPAIGYVCSLYRGVAAQSWFEKLELLSLHDSTAHFLFAETTGASDYCLGSSVAIRREQLDAIGGFEPLGDYLVEDYEMGRRIQALGLKPGLVPYAVDIAIDLEGPRDWWRHQVYWDQNTRGARPLGFFATIVIKALPFALLFAIARLFDPLSLAVLGGTLALRLASSAAVMALLRDGEGLRSLAWLPLRDLGGLASWMAAMRRPNVVWRGSEYELTRDARLVPVAKPR